MRLKQLEYFIEIAKTGSISIAAQNLFVSQPALSNAIHQLENELEISLLIRSSKGVQLSQEGNCLLPMMEQCVADAENIKRRAYELRDSRISLKKDITIYTVPVIVDTFLYKAVKTLEQNYPSIHVTIQLIKSSEWKRYLPAHATSTFEEIFFLINHWDDSLQIMDVKDLVVKKLFDGKMVIVTGRRSPLIGTSAISLKDLFQFEHIVPYNGYDRKKILESYAEGKEEMKICLCSNDLEIIKNELANNSKAVYLVHEMVAKKNFFDLNSYHIVKVNDYSCDYIAVYSPVSAFCEVYEYLFSIIKKQRDHY